MMIGLFVRLALTIYLLMVVWVNAHWSVALTLTLIYFRIELEAAISRRRLYELLDITKKLDRNFDHVFAKHDKSPTIVSDAKDVSEDG